MLSKDLACRRGSYKYWDIEYSATNIREIRREDLNGIKYGCVGKMEGWQTL